jgi:hypothetical protein
MHIPLQPLHQAISKIRPSRTKEKTYPSNRPLPILRTLGPYIIRPIQLFPHDRFRQIRIRPATERPFAEYEFVAVESENLLAEGRRDGVEREVDVRDDTE